MEKKVLYFKATSYGKPITVQEPVEKNIIGLVISELMSENGGPVTDYAIDYNMAYLKTFYDEKDFRETPPELVFEGKQYDFFYCFYIRDYLPTDDDKVDTKQVLDLINSGKGKLRLQWWELNDAMATDNPDISGINGELVYNIELTDELTLQVAVEGELNEEFFMDAMKMLCTQVSKGEYSLRAFYDVASLPSIWR